MADGVRILLTNDDGIESPGIRALYDDLSTVADVTVVAPTADQSAVGRSISREVSVVEHELGYALEGTPADCVVAGVAELVSGPDLVVSGCNEGANLGEYGLGRSGTVSAAIEAAFFEVPAIATSLYIPAGNGSYRDRTVTTAEFDEAARFTSYLVSNAFDEGVIEPGSYLNVNVPLTESDGLSVELTRPSTRYEMDAMRNGRAITLADRIWETMDPETIPDPAGTDRRAIVEGRISVSPLSAPQRITADDALERIVENYPIKKDIPRRE